MTAAHPLAKLQRPLTRADLLEHMGEALKWWRQRLDRTLLPNILPR